MALPKRYNPRTAEPEIQARWHQAGVHQFEPASEAPVYAIDSPPPTVSGNLHLGHTYSYSQADFMARFWRMNGYNVFYPMGYDDNGLPTERLVERWEGVTARDIGREAFIERCLAVSEKAEEEYQALWERLGLSIDWRYSYRTIDEQSRRISQLSFIDLYRKGLAYRTKAPSIWCPECQTAIAQAELNDLARSSEFYTLDFRLPDGGSLPIATTRPELLPACVAIFIHPEDDRFQHLLGQSAAVPIFGQAVPIMADPGADPEKGTGIVMCCTFGDTADVEWWHKNRLPLVEAIDREGKMTALTGPLSGLDTQDARSEIVRLLEANGSILGREPVAQEIRVHERCDTPVEYIVTMQWFVRLMDAKQRLIAAGDQIAWHPAHMKARYQQWVENLGWDWCITRQRYFGVTFPVWYCEECGEIKIADESQLPVDPTEQVPASPCTCRSSRFIPEEDVMDTWATSALTPQIVGKWQSDKSLYEKVFPMSLRPQAHEIIRTWAFYTIAKSLYHFDTLPWDSVAISGWGLAPEGAAKISKSRGGGPVSPMEMIDRYSADALRYWSASTSLGKDAIISEEKIQAGARLVTKLWNVARFAQRFLAGDVDGRSSQASEELISAFTPADAWLMARNEQIIERVTELYRNYDYAAAKSEVEGFFWRDFADNYLEMAKKRLYDSIAESTGPSAADGAVFALGRGLLTVIKLFAPVMPHVTERIYAGLFAQNGDSLHRSSWPTPDERLSDAGAIATGELLVEIATAVRRFKSESSLSLGAELARIQLGTPDAELVATLQRSAADLISVTRANQLDIGSSVDSGHLVTISVGPVELGLSL